VSEALAFYGEQRAPKTSSATTIGYHIDALLGFWGDKVLENISPETCMAYVSWRSKQPIRHFKNAQKTVSVQTARRELVTLQAAVRLFGKSNRMIIAPAFALPEAGPPKDRWLTVLEFTKLLNAARKLKLRHLCRFLLIGLYTGSRHATILGLTWMPSTQSGWIDTEHGLIYRRGRDERETRKRRPTARLPHELLRHLRRWKRIDAHGYQSSRMRTAGEARKPLTHVIHYHGKPISEIDTAFNRARDLAKLGSDVTPHTLRHTLATWAMQGGADKWQLAGYAGMSLKTLEATYGHHHPDFQDSISVALRKRKAAN
jgi:integrase